MVNTLACTSARSAAVSPASFLPANAPSTPHLPSRKVLSWIKRRTRRLQTFFVLSRREALSAAVLDWADLNPASAL
jgi:hypothetical protein